MQVSKKELAIFLSTLKGFQKPKLRFEQYETPSEVASSTLFAAFDDIVGKTVIDLGCGTGILAIGAGILGAEFVVGVEIDFTAIKISLGNLKQAEEVFGSLNVKFVCTDALYFRPKTKFKTCIMNPPFGVQRRGADRVFIKTAMESAEVVWTFMNFSSRPFVEALSKEQGFTINFFSHTKLPIRASMPHHKSKVKWLPADIYRLCK